MYKISIITPVLNQAQLLEKCIFSVISQVYHNIEYIIIDGGSIDGTLEIIKKYGSKISYFVSEPDEGIYDAINKGIKKATGDWIYILGADDSLTGNNILSEVFSDKRIENENPDLILCNLFVPNQNRKIIYSLDLESLLKNGISQQAVIYNKNIFEKLGYFDIRYKISADSIFHWKALHEKYKWLLMDKTICNFSDRGISSSYAFEKDKLFFDEKEKIAFEYFGNLFSMRALVRLLNHDVFEHALMELKKKDFKESYNVFRRILKKKFVFYYVLCYMINFVKHFFLWIFLKCSDNK